MLNYISKISNKLLPNTLLLVVAIILSFSSNNAFAFDVPNFIALSKQRSLLDKFEIVSNNIANSETIGFKETKLIEREFKVVYPTPKNNIYNNDISTIRDMKDGALSQTNNKLDFAILGKGFFLIKTPNGIKLTRAGNFTISNQNIMVTMQGYPVLDSSRSEIVIPENSRDIIVDQNGFIVVDDNNIGKIGIGTIDQLNLLKPEDKNLYNPVSEDNIHSVDEKNYRISQGFIESSNVDKVRQLTDLIEVQRDISLVTGFMDTYNDMTISTISTLGKPN